VSSYCEYNHVPVRFVNISINVNLKPGGNRGSTVQRPEFPGFPWVFHFADWESEVFAKKGGVFGPFDPDTPDKYSSEIGGMVNLGRETLFVYR
jgi:hypothetical protein